MPYNGINQINHQVIVPGEDSLETSGRSSLLYDSYDEISDNSSDGGSSTAELDTSYDNYDRIDVNDDDPYHENEILKEARHKLFTLRTKTTGFRARTALPYKYLSNNHYFNDFLKNMNASQKIYRPIDKQGFNNLQPFNHFYIYNDRQLLNAQLMTYDFRKESMRNEEYSIEDTEKNSQFIYSTLLFSYDSFRFIGSPTTTKLREGISDAIVVNACNDVMDDILLLVQPNGMLLSILPTKNIGNSEIDFNLEMSTVLQYWDLGCRGDWKITAEQSSRIGLNFIITDTVSGNIKFFRFLDKYEFTMVNNLCLDDYTIQSCEFFVSNVKNYSANNINAIEENDTSDDINNSQSNDPIMLFVATTHAERVVHLCIEWSNLDPYHKRVHQLTYQKNYYNYNSIPLQQNRVLTSQKDGLTLISANQIMSGETSFITAHLPNNMKGIISWFSCSLLLKKLQSLNSEQFDQYSDCIVAASATGTIFACLISSTTIDLHPLTRFKGVSFISPSYLPSLENESLRYNMKVMSFNRMVNIRINLLNTLNSTSVLAYQNVLSRKTEDISSDNNTKIAIIKNNVWVFSNSSVSQITNVINDRDPLPYLKVSEAVENLRIFNIYNNIKTFKLDALTSWQTFLDIEFPDDSLLIIGTDKEQVMDIYLLKPLHDAENEETNFEIINLEGILVNNFNTTSIPLLFEPYKEFLIYVDEECVSVLSIETGSVKTYTAEFKIDGATFSLGVIVLWNSESSILNHFCHNIIEWFHDTTGDVHFESVSENKSGAGCSKSGNKLYFIDKLNYENSDKFELFLAVPYLLYPTLYQKNTDKRKRDSISTQVNDFIVLDGLRVYSAEGAVIQGIKLGDDKYRSIYLPLLPTGPQDIQLRKFTRSSVLAFTANRVFIINFRDLNNYDLHFPFLYELKIPYQGKENLILDISVQSDDEISNDPMKCTLYILFANGLKIFKPNYYSWTYTNCLLKYTRSNNKTFIYLERLNRLAVINYDYNDWYCIKLENGKVLALDNSVFEKDHKLINVVDVNIHSKSKQYDTLLFVFERLIKVVEVSSKNGKVTVRCLQTKVFNAELSKQVCVTPERIYLLRVNMQESGNSDTFSRDYNIEDNRDSMFHIILKGIDQEIFIENEVKFYGRGDLGMFHFFANKYAIITDSTQSRLLQDRNVDQKGTFDPASFFVTDLPTDSKVVKIIPITEFVSVVAVELGERAQYSSKLIFLGYHDRNFNAVKTEREANDYAEVLHSINRAASEGASFIENMAERSSSSYYNESLELLYEHPHRGDSRRENSTIRMPISGGTIDSNKYAIQSYALSLSDPVYHCKYNGYTRIINIQEKIQDMTYSPDQKILAVLCSDQTVLQFKMGGTYNQEWINSSMVDASYNNDATYIPPRSKRPKENHGMLLRDIDTYGRIWT
ncbi:similar to Saccharomyces cerevisiae YPR164W MMS1 Subunit of an E3 ubiquitin ligase complex [Maudiozyma saulgeensis]|uniref:Similar to Saccharomyces cerevisiae YPR164W MMS1 Subunit of an E3 ubiquitin ligase complex n=1 Tax=Maudiozyma saulgeensis TaxID=1789683 RepID=A0A1X7R6J8_9SACH|nr:similar to Saccharomyces cerevisiae YPR164W MMS1 Subunit of an E3 ubiquitin ligase complex [Kazachstania saulgeensis]